MGENKSGRRKHRVPNRKSLAVVSVALAFMTVLLAAQMMAAAGPAGQDQVGPFDPNPGTPSPYAGVISTTEELLAAPPSIERYIAAHTIPNALLIPANFTQSSKTVVPAQAGPNGVVKFTVLVRNSGDVDAQVEVTDDLPNQLSFISVNCNAFITDTCAHSGGVVTWKGTAAAQRDVTITINARVANNATEGAKITNTAEIKTGGNTITRSATVTVGRRTASPLNYVPLTIYGLRPDPMPVTLTAGSPNGANQWLISWTASVGATGYELQESNTPDFANPTSYMTAGDKTSLPIQKSLSPFNVYYYRARSMVGQLSGPWSNVERVVGGYRDDFTSNNTGWKIRRTTYKEEVHGFYEITDTKNWYVIQSDDRWDWGIASPGMPAPRVPYAIEYQAEPANLANLLSFGLVFGGDWPSASCPSDPNSFDGIYKHKDCFNHFYNPNSIFYGPLKLLFERVDRLEWCLTCGGSPMKRLGDINPNRIRDYQGVDPDGWNKYRIEVRSNSIRIYAGRPTDAELRFQYEYTDTRWVNDPYFGVFASTDEYSNSTWRFEYVQIVPLDN